MAELRAKYQQYEEYKDSDIEWLGKIPKNWISTQVKYGFTVVLGKMLQTTPKSNADLLKPYLKAQNIQPFGVDLTNVGSMWFSADERKRLLLKKKDVLVSEGGDVGRAAIWNDEIDECYIQNAINRVRPRYSNDSRFFYYWINYLKATDFINIICNKATIAHYTVDKLQGSPLILPSVLEQVQIANFLDFETAQIDTLIEKQQTLIQLLKEKSQAVISHTVTPSENEKSAKLGYFVDLLSGYSFSSEGYKTETKGNTALLRGINVGVGVLKWDETVWWSRTDKDGLEAFELKEGDIVFGMDRPWISAGARVAEVTKADLPCLLLQRVIRIRSNKDTYQPFIKLCLASKKFKFSVEADLTGVSVPHISPDQVKSFPIRDVGYEQQKFITDDAFEKMKVLDLIENSTEQAIQLMQERRTALISAAVTGKIDVRGWRAAELL